MNPERDFSYLNVAAVAVSMALITVLVMSENKLERTQHGNGCQAVDSARKGDSKDIPTRGPETDARGSTSPQGPVGSRGLVMLAAGASDTGRVGHAGRSVRQLFNVSAYCPCEKCCGKHADGITASGKPVTFNGGHFVAADKGIPFGTLISIPGYHGGKPVPVLDVGGAIKGNRLDVFFPTHQEALNWGRQYLTCEVMK